VRLPLQVLCLNVPKWPVFFRHIRLLEKLGLSYASLAPRSPVIAEFMLGPPPFHHRFELIEPDLYVSSGRVRACRRLPRQSPKLLDLDLYVKPRPPLPPIVLQEGNIADTFVGSALHHAPV